MLFLFLAFLFLLMKRLYIDAKKTKYWSPFLGLLGFVIANLTLVSFSMFEMGLLIAVFANKHFVEQHKKRLLITQNQR